MDQEMLTGILTHFRSYRYAARMGAEFLNDGEPVYSERRLYLNRWDATRYTRIVHAISGAIDEVLTDEQAAIIQYHYLERNPLTITHIATTMHMDRKTVQRKHNQALVKLGIALDFVQPYPEITPFEHMFIR